MPSQNYPYSNFDKKYNEDFNGGSHSRRGSYESSSSRSAGSTHSQYSYDHFRSTPTSRRYQPQEPPPSKSGARAFIAFFIVVILILSILISSTLFFNNFLPTKKSHREIPESLNFTLKKEIIISTPAQSTTPTSFTYRAACPKDRYIADIQLQDVTEVEPTPRPDNGYPDITTSDPDFMVWSDNNFLGTMRIDITYTITTRTLVWDITEDISGNMEDIPQSLKDQYLHDEWQIDYDNDYYLDPNEDIDDDGEWDYLIEMSNPQISELAESLTASKDNVYLKVKTIYDYITSPERLNYITSDGGGIPQDCVSTLESAKGDCDDYSILFISLSRAAGIPAWLELGIIYDPDLGKWGGHAWTKVCIPFNDGTYTIATIDIVNREFLVHDSYRVIEWIDTGGDIMVEGKPINNLEYYYHSFSYVIRNDGNGYTYPKLTERFVTKEFKEIGDKIKIPIESPEDEETQSIPSFELIIITIAIIVNIYFIKIKKLKVIR